MRIWIKVALYSRPCSSSSLWNWIDQPCMSPLSFKRIEALTRESASSVCFTLLPGTEWVHMISDQHMCIQSTVGRLRTRRHFNFTQQDGCLTYGLIRHLMFSSAHGRCFHITVICLENDCTIFLWDWTLSDRTVIHLLKVKCGQHWAWQSCRLFLAIKAPSEWAEVWLIKD